MTELLDLQIDVYSIFNRTTMKHESNVNDIISGFL